MDKTIDDNCLTWLTLTVGTCMFTFPLIQTLRNFHFIFIGQLFKWDYHFFFIVAPLSLSRYYVNVYKLKQRIMASQLWHQLLALKWFIWLVIGVSRKKLIISDKSIIKIGYLYPLQRCPSVRGAVRCSLISDVSTVNSLPSCQQSSITGMATLTWCWYGWHPKETQKLMRRAKKQQEKNSSQKWW